MDSGKMIARARTQLVLNNPFFGSLVLYLQPVAANDIDTVATDGDRLFYNPKWVYLTYCKNNGQDKLVGAVCHEVLHPALDHFLRRQERDKTAWNIAADYAINDIILHSVDHKGSRMVLPDGFLYDEEYSGLSAEAIYSRIQWQRSKSGGRGGKAGGEQPWGDHGRWRNTLSDPKRAARQSQEWKVRVSQAADAARRRGCMPAGLDCLVKELLYPKMDWHRALATFLQPVRCDYSFYPPDRRFLSGAYGEYEGIVLPDFQDDGLEDVVVAVDTSGSISDRELSQFLSEVIAITRAFPRFHGHLVLCDAGIQGWYDLGDDGTVQTNMKGRGGTDFRPVFQEVAKRGLWPTALIYLTDGCGAFPESDPGYPVLWVMVDDGHVKAPFGAQVALKAS